jgi:hypothetical protein
MTMIKNDTDKPMFVDPTDLGEKRSDGGPAFPFDYPSSCHTGMSLRDYFAGQVAGGMAARDTFDQGQATPEQRATLAYIEADAMLKARAR